MIGEEELEGRERESGLPYVTYILLTIVSQMVYVHNTPRAYRTKWLLRKNGKRGCKHERSFVPKGGINMDRSSHGNFDLRFTRDVDFSMPRRRQRSFCNVCTSLSSCLN